MSYRDMVCNCRDAIDVIRFRLHTCDDGIEELVLTAQPSSLRSTAQREGDDRQRCFDGYRPTLCPDGFFVLAAFKSKLPSPTMSVRA